MSSPFPIDFDSFPKELRLLLALMKIEQDDKSLCIQKELAADIDWDWFLQLVRHHRVSSIINDRLKKVDQSWIPAYIIQTLHLEYHNNIFRMLHLSGELERICKLFAEVRVRTLLLKGPMLALDLYGDISLRTSGDLDILVNISDLVQVNKLLLEQGYESDDIILTLLNSWKWRQHHITYFHPQKRIYIEVHWRLSPGPSKEPSFQQLWERKRKKSLTSYPLYYLGEADLFGFLVSHGARHGWSRLRWLLDIDILARRQMDWEKMGIFLAKYQSYSIGGQALILASRLLNTPLSNEMQTLANHSRSRRLAQAALIFIKEPVNLYSNPPEDLARNYKRYLFTMKSKRQKILYILNIFYPYPMDAKTLPLPKYIHFLYVPLRPLLWAWRKARQVLT